MKVLRRLTAVRADGSCALPMEIVEKFKDIVGGGRAEVMELFEKSDCNKDLLCFNSSACVPLQKALKLLTPCILPLPT